MIQSTPGSHNLNPLWIALIAAAASLFGTLVGGWITNRNQKKERRNRRIREQLSFYSTLVALKMEIDVKTATQKKANELNKKARDADLQVFAGDPSSAAQVLLQRLPSEERSYRYDQEQYKTEIVPRYKRMLQYWSEHMDLPESSTVEYYKDLAYYIESHDRAENSGYAAGVVTLMIDQLPNLDPLFKELREQMEKLRKDLKEPGLF